jgi:hypothetical protein
MFNYRLFCGVRPRKFVVAGQIGPTKKHLPEVTGQTIFAMAGALVTVYTNLKSHWRLCSPPRPTASY